MKRFRKLWMAGCVAACVALAACGNDAPEAGTDGSGNDAQAEYSAALEREKESAQAEHESEMANKEGNTKPADDTELAPNKGDGNGMAGLGGGGSEESSESSESDESEESGSGNEESSDAPDGNDEEEEAEPWDPLDELLGQGCLDDYYDVPDWNGQPWAVLNGNSPYFIIPDEGDGILCESYASLDDKMRPGQVIVCTDYDGSAYADYSAKPQQGAGEVPGWNDDTYSKIIATIPDEALLATGGSGNNRLYYMRRLAGIGDQALGRKNTIVCTQYMGACGMDALDALVMEYLEKTRHERKVLVRITPVFLENELVARGVVYEAISIGDTEEEIAAGQSLCFNMFCYNVQPGVDINYGTGESSQAEGTAEYLYTVNSRSFVLDAALQQAHVPGCRHLVDSVELGDQELYYGTASALSKWSDQWAECECMADILKAFKKAR